MEKESFPGFYDTSSAGHIPAHGKMFRANEAIRELAEWVADITLIFVYNERRDPTAERWMKMIIIGLSGAITGNARITGTVMSIRL